MLDFLWHLWEAPPVRLQLSCPAAAEGTTGNAYGSYDDASVRAAYQLVSIESIASVIIAVFLCYMIGRMSTGARFSLRWWIVLAITMLWTGGITWWQLSHAATTALAGSCESNPTAFPVALPFANIVQRSIVGLVWALLAFPIVSFVLTRVLGYFPTMWNGFFHFRGTPWPRFSPWSK